jgi:hypothetical protein
MLGKISADSLVLAEGFAIHRVQVAERVGQSLVKLNRA